MKTSVQPGRPFLPALQSSSVCSTVAKTMAAIALSSLVTCTVIAQTNSGGCVNAPTGLVSWWRGEGNMLDSIHANHGTNFGSISNVPGIVGNGFGFAGNSYIIVPHHPTLNASNALTIELWYNSAQSNNVYYGIIDKRIGASGANYGINVAAEAGLGVYYDDPAVTDGDDLGSNFETSRYVPVPEPGVFHHLAVTYLQFSNNLVRLQTYIDGQNVRTRYISGRLANTLNTAPVTIGATAQGFGEFFQGVIDEISIYNRVLGAAEIQSIYAAGSAGKCAGGTTNPPVTLASTPVIYNVSPSTATAGSQVFLSGTNFSPMFASNIVYFGATRAAVSAATPTNLIVTVPLGATHAPVTVTVNGRTAFSPRAFLPTFGGTGTNITTASFAPGKNLTVADGPIKSFIADLDGDGKPDLVEANAYAHNISLFRNISVAGTLDGSSFAPRVDFPVLGGTDSPRCLAVADVDGDGKLDILIGDQATSGAIVYRNISTPGSLTTSSFAAPVGFPGGGYPHGIHVADLNGDGLPEILVANQYSESITILKNIGSAGTLTTNSFAPQYALLAGPAPTDVGIADLNGDGRPDLVTTAFDGSQLWLFRNVATPSAAVSNWFTLDASLPAAAGSLEITLTDLDGDAKSDLVVAAVQGHAVSVYRNQAGPGAFTTNSFGTRIDYGTPGWAHSISVADFNGDAKPDLAVVGELDSYLGVFQNQSTPGNINLAPRVDFGTGWNAWGVAAGDLDGDNRADIVFANSYDDTLTFYRNIMPSSLTNPPGSCVIVPSGAVSWWRGEGNAIDELQANNGTLVGNVSFAAGIAGAAFNFTNDAHYVQVPASLTLNVGLANGFTVEAWINPAGTPDEQPIAEWAVTNGYGVHFFTWSSGAIYANLVSTDGSHHILESASGVLLPNQPNHVALTYDKIVGWGRLMVNGLTVAEANLGSFTPRTDTDLLIGYRQSTSPFGPVSFLGFIDEISLYNRSLGTNELAAIFHAGAAGKCAGNNPPPIPPTITSQPTNRTVVAGQIARFDVTATGTAPLAYQWFFNNSSNAILGATNPTYAITNAQPIQSGAYYVIVSNPSGVVTSSVATLTVVSTQAVQLVDGTTPGFYNEALGTILDGTAPQFPLPFGQGDDPTIFPAEEPPLSAAAGILGNWLATPPNLNSNWQVMPVIPDTWALNTETAIIYPLVTDSYGISNLRGDFDADNGIYVWVNGQYKFGARAPGLPSPVGQFEYTNVFLGSLPPGTNYIQVLREDSGITAGYQIRLTGTTMTTNPVPPVIVQPPTNQTVAAGSSAVFTVVAAGTPEFSYQWRFGGANLSGRTNSSLTLANVQPINGGDYSVVVSNPYGAVTSSVATLTVLTFPPTITKQPTNLAAIVTTAASFSVQATGSVTLAYQWLFNGQPLAGKTATNLTFTSVQFSNAGNYSVIVTNPYGAVTSSVATLSVNPIPPCASVHDGLVSWWKGENSALDNWGMNNPQTSIPRYATGKVGMAFSGPFLNIADSPSLRITSGLTIEAWVNPVTSQSPQVILAKHEYPGFQPSGTQSAYLLGLTNNSALFFTLTPNGSVRTNTILVTTNTLPLNQWSHVAATYDGAVMRLYLNGTLVGLRSHAGGIYPGNTPLGIGGFAVGTSSPWQFTGLLDEVSLYNRALSDTEIQTIINANLVGKCLAPPIITQSPQSQIIPLGEDVKFSVEVSGSRPLTYQWYFNGLNTQFTNQRIIGATNATLILEKIRTNNIGAYFVTVTNSLGSNYSATAQLTTLPAPSCVDVLPGLISWWPGDGNLSDAMGNNLVTSYSGTYSTGKVANAFVFNGNTSRISVNSSTSLNFTNQQNFSIEMWIKTTNRLSSPTGGPTIYPNIPLFEKRDSVSTGWKGYSLSLYNGQLAFSLGAQGVNANGIFISSSPDLRDGFFHHIAVTLNRTASNGGVLYVDGTPVLVFDPRAFTNSLSTPSSLAIGAPTVPISDTYFAGWIDEPAIYNRALTPVEIQSIRTAGAAGRCKSAPAIITQPVGGNVVSGSNFTMSVLATGTPNLRYQWRRNNQFLFGSTNASLILSNFNNSQVGTYSVIVSNGFGTVISSNAIVALNRLPIANADAFNTTSNTPATFPISKLLLNDTDADGDALTVTAVSSNSAQNGTVSLVAGQVTYTPHANFTGNDTFTYVLSDNRGGTAIGTVMATAGSGGAAPLNMVYGPTVANGEFVVRFAGIPGLTYTIEATPSFQVPWTKVANVTAPTTDTGLGIGVFEFREPVAGETSRYYRTVYPSY